MADSFVSLGLTALGYTYMNTDDCWSSAAWDPNSGSGRGADGRILPDPKFTPDGAAGMAALARYIRSRGMQFGETEGAAGTRAR